MSEQDSFLQGLSRALAQKDIALMAHRQARAYRDMMAHELVCLDDAIVALADANAVAGVASLLADRAALDLGLTFRALCVKSDEPATALCSAAGLTVNAYSAVLRMRRRGLPAAAEPPSEMLGRYLKLSREAARRILQTIAAQAAESGDF